MAGGGEGQTRQHIVWTCVPFSEHPGGDFTFFGPLSVAFEGGIINSVIFHFFILHLQSCWVFISVFMKMGRLRHTIYH